MDDRIKTLLQQSNKMFDDRGGLLSLWQEIGDNFYPERANFTINRSIGQDFAGFLTTSYPLMARRSLGDIFSTMLRPTDKEWFEITTQRADKNDYAAKAWLQWATKVQKRAMYARVAQFERATKEGDHDFAAFGQTCLSVELNRAKNNLLFRCWHLRDMAWIENYLGEICRTDRKWEPEVGQLNRMFDGRGTTQEISADAKKLLKDNPTACVRVRRIILPTEDYEGPAGGKKWNTPYVSIYFEEDNGHILEEVGSRTKVHCIPRWQTVSGSQYAFSPATIVALPDARLIQSMTLTLLEAGEKAVNPPLKTPGDVVRSDYQLFAGGVTAYESDYDESTGKVLEPLYQVDKGGFSFGTELRNDTRQMITEAFYLNKVALPPASGKVMTAYETGQRVQEYIRNAMPIFSPMEANYNGDLCELVFETMKMVNAFGDPRDMPQSLRGADITFEFQSPLHEAIEQQKGAIFQQARGLVAEAIALDPSSQFIVDGAVSLRDTLEGIGVPSPWMRPPEVVSQMADAQAKKQQTAETLDLLQKGGAAAQQIGDAGQSLTQMVNPQGSGGPQGGGTQPAQ